MQLLGWLTVLLSLFPTVLLVGSGYILTARHVSLEVMPGAPEAEIPQSRLQELSDL